MTKYNCIIIDDDDIDRLTVRSYVQKFPLLNIIGDYESATESLPAIEKENIEVVFLDIDMPDANGIEFRKKILHIPVCIFITSHPEYALESFEIDTFDFIIKPLNLDRFSHTAKRLQEFMEIRQKALLFESCIGGDSIYIKEGHIQTKIKLHDILYLEALKDYTLIVTRESRHCILSNIGTLLTKPHFKAFVRVHRSFAVQKHYIKKIKFNEIELNNDFVVPVGRSYKDNLNYIL